MNIISEYKWIRLRIWEIMLICTAISACAPRMNSSYNTSIPKLPVVEFYESFAMVDSTRESEIDLELKIGSIKIGDSGFTFFCDYETVKQLAASEARKMGGNCIIIRKHSLPDWRSTCHRIEAEVLKVRNPEQFEEQILWHPLRRLTITNFRGTTDKRPFLAATSSSFRYAIKMNNITGKSLLQVESYFDCISSYFKPSDQDSAVLAHEQLHFDITEIYARKFRKKVKEVYLNPRQFAAIHESLYKNIFHEMVLKQDEYDSEVYADHLLQSKWNTWVKTELDLLQDFKSIEMEL